MDRTLTDRTTALLIRGQRAAREDAALSQVLRRCRQLLSTMRRIAPNHYEIRSTAVMALREAFDRWEEQAGK